MHRLFYRFFCGCLISCFTFLAYSENDSITIDTSMLNQEFETFEESNFDANLDSVQKLWYVENAMQPDTALEEPELDAAIPTFSDAEYMERLSLIPTIVPLSYNKIVRNFIEGGFIDWVS